jgi:hypothetical protein
VAKLDGSLKLVDFGLPAAIFCLGWPVDFMSVLEISGISLFSAYEYGKRQTWTFS